MSPLQQLLAMVDGMSEHDDDFREVRAMKPLANEVKQDDK